MFKTIKLKALKSQRFLSLVKKYNHSIDKSKEWQDKAYAIGTEIAKEFQVAIPESSELTLVKLTELTVDLEEIP